MARRRSRRRSTGERDKPEGWAAVEEDMLEHDEGTMEGHAKDVDTLLVFAGLFSAVLTAFVVESYQQLQVDTDQKSMFLLQRISIQLESFTLSPGFANCSTKPPLPSLDFVADATARWINTLWFLSLIFSLAAALFGILVKQWIREYMQWNSALASPRENVLVRQIRFEAWNNWNVPATIAVVPALLEIALVLFVCGLVVLLWTLDTVVSIVITTAVAVFLTAASTFIVLPAFFVRCPYKSPTAWACAFVWDIVTLWIPHSVARAMIWLWLRASRPWQDSRIGSWVWRKCKYVNYRIAIWKPLAVNWRQRDLAAVWTSPVTQTRRGDVAPLLQELLRLEQEPIDASAGVAGPHYDVSGALVWKEQQVPLHNAIRTITEFPPLVRALAWVSQASQDARTQENVSRCLDALESHFVLPNPIRITGCTSLTQDRVRALSIWYFISSASPDVAAALGLGDAGRSITAIRGCAHDRCSKPYRFIEVLSITESHGVLPVLHVLLQILALSIRTLVERLTKGPFNDSADVRLYAQRAREQLGMVLQISEYRTDNTLPLQSAARHLMEALRISDGDIRDSFESAFVGLRWYILRAAKELRDNDTPWSLLDELHVSVPPFIELDSLMQDEMMRGLSHYRELLPLPKLRQRQREAQTSLYARIYPPNISFSPPASTTLFAPVHHTTAELDDQSPLASSSGHGDAAGEGKQGGPAHSQDLEAGKMTFVNDISILTRREDFAGERGNVGVSRPQERAVGSSSTALQPPASSSDGYGSNGHEVTVADNPEGAPGVVNLQDLTTATIAAAPEQLVFIPDISGNGDTGDEGEIQDAEHLQGPEMDTTVTVPRESCSQAGSGGSGLDYYGAAEGESAATCSWERQESTVDTTITASGVDVPGLSDDEGGGNEAEGGGLVADLLQDGEADNAATKLRRSTPRNGVPVLRGGEETSRDNAGTQGSQSRGAGVETAAPWSVATSMNDGCRPSGSSGHEGAADEGNDVDGRSLQDMKIDKTVSVPRQISPGGSRYAADGDADAAGEDEDVDADAGPSGTQRSVQDATVTPAAHRSSPNSDGHEGAADNSEDEGGNGRSVQPAANSTAGPSISNVPTSLSGDSDASRQ